MKYDEERGVYALTTGCHFAANRGILGMNDALEISEGYDGGVYLRDPVTLNSGAFTSEERREVAEFMIACWKKWGGIP